MTAVSVTQAKNNLSKLLKKVRNGHSVLILDRKVPVARLEPLPPGSKEADEAYWIEMEREGLVKLPKRKLPKDFWTRPLPKLKGSLVRTLLEMREEERREARW